MFRKCRGFTLIELLIVVAIIAILAAIAVPNFLEAQVRAKVTRGKNDMRAMATALEAYRIDENKYPMDYQFYQGYGSGGGVDRRSWPIARIPLARLTTPVAYMTSLPKNVFKYTRGWWDGDPDHYGYKTDDAWRNVLITFNNPALRNSSGQMDANMSRLWVLITVGPDQTASAGEYALFGEHVINRMVGATSAAGNGPALYDPTNGTMSVGDLVRVGP